MTNEECDRGKVCDLLIFGVSGGSDTLKELRHWFEGLSVYHSGQLSQEANRVVRAAISVLDQMIYEKVCLACQYCLSQVFDSQMPINNRAGDPTMHKQMERRLLSQLSVLAM